MYYSEALAAVRIQIRELEAAKLKLVTRPVVSVRVELPRKCALKDADLQVAQALAGRRRKRAPKDTRSRAKHRNSIDAG